MEWICVSGDSMAPFLQSGDAVAVDWLERADELRRFPIGSVLLARESGDAGEWILHRVTHHSTERIFTKGDSSFAWDSFNGSEVWGIVREIRLQAEPQRPRAFTVSSLDRLIARFSRETVPPDTLSARVARKVVRALGAWRRKSL